MSRQIQCEKCSHLIAYDDSAPKFCSECGGSLGLSDTSIRDDQTVARTPISLKTDVDANTVSPDLTKPISPEHIRKFNLETVGPYRLVRKLGQGGMGTVYEAVHTNTGRNVALKLLSPEVRGTEEMVQRFKRESQIAASINHPRSTFVYEAGQHEDQFYITMELMGGGTLKEVVADEGPLPVGRAVDYLLDMIEGLLVAHNAGIVHRDIKPSNSFVDSEGRIKVGDFGLAKSFLGDSSLTQTGTFMGTPQYAAPEQIRNADVDERTDIYALGGTLFYLLTGRAPFVGNPAQVISSIASDVPPKVSEFARNVPRPLVRLIGQTLEKNPDRRPFNLNMLRDGLLPFSTRGAMAADPGRRLAAFFLDTIIIAGISGLMIGITSPVVMFLLAGFGIDANPQITGVLILFPIVILYYSICEARWGRTAGKWIFGMRVVNRQAESPSFPAALIRAALIPGVTMAVSQFASLYFVDIDNLGDLNDVMAMTLKSQSLGLIAWIPMLMMISIARRENGYQCVHGLFSGTHVVRLAGDLESTLLDYFAVAVPAKFSGRKQLGDFEILGLFQQTDDGQSTYLGRDRELDRAIWLFEGPANHLSEPRKHLTRPSRLRVINQSTEAGSSWYATESVPGLPLQDVLKNPGIKWQSVCSLIRDISQELAVSVENDLIPVGLSIDHLWLDHTGRIRILDHVLVHSTNAAKTKPQAGTSKAAAVETVQTVLKQFMENHDHPVFVMDLSRELEERREQVGVFDWLVSELNETSERPSSWNWVDRIGMLAISSGLELSVMSAAVFMSGFLVMVANQGPVLRTAFSGLAGLALVAGFGYFFDGGPAMRLSGIGLRRNKDKCPASRMRSIVRSIIAWSPWVVLMSMLMFVIFYQLENDPEVTQLNPENSQVFVNVLLYSLIPFFLVFAGLIFAVVSPRRGIPDFLAGTRMMRK